MIDTAAAEEAEGVYELRTYTCEEGRLPALHQRFHDHTLKLFEKHGMRNIAYFTPADQPTADDTLVYLLWHESREAAADSWKAFQEDSDWQRARKESEQDGKILAKAPESTFMTATDYSPEPAGATEDVAYELRIYTAADGKLEALHNRFRQHTLKLFEKHGMANVGYWSPSDEPNSENQLIYLIAHKSREAAAESWKAFVNDPEWKKAAAESEADGKLVDKVESTYLKATEYSPD